MAWNLNENMKITNLLNKIVSPFCSINMQINIPINNEHHYRSHVPACFISYNKLSKPADVCILHFHGKNAVFVHKQGGGMVANTPASHEKTLKSLSKKVLSEFTDLTWKVELANYFSRLCSSSRASSSCSS